MQAKNLTKSSNDEHGYMAAFRNLEHKIENMFNNFWHNPFSTSEENIRDTTPMSFMGGMPRVDVIDRDREILVKAELPGIEKENIDVSITNNHLFIKAKTSHEEKKEEDNYLRREMTSSEFYRSIHLPANIDESHVKSTFKNGLLELVIPKKEDSFRRKISID